MLKVRLDLTEYIPYGETQILVRARAQDINDVNRAVRLLGTTKSQFVRTLVIQAARIVIAEYAAKDVA